MDEPASGFPHPPVRFADAKNILHPRLFNVLDDSFIQLDLHCFLQSFHEPLAVLILRIKLWDFYYSSCICNRLNFSIKDSQTSIGIPPKFNFGATGLMRLDRGYMIDFLVQGFSYLVNVGLQSLFCRFQISFHMRRCRITSIL